MAAPAHTRHARKRPRRCTPRNARPSTPARPRAKRASRICSGGHQQAVNTCATDGPGETTHSDAVRAMYLDTSENGSDFTAVGTAGAHADDPEIHGTGAAQRARRRRVDDENDTDRDRLRMAREKPWRWRTRRIGSIASMLRDQSIDASDISGNHAVQ